MQNLLAQCGICYSKPGWPRISRNKNINFIRFFFFLYIFLLAHRAGGSQVLLAPPQLLLAPGKRAMPNVSLTLIWSPYPVEVRRLETLMGLPGKLSPTAEVKSVTLRQSGKSSEELAGHLTTTTNKLPLGNLRSALKSWQDPNKQLRIMTSK